MARHLPAPEIMGDVLDTLREVSAAQALGEELRSRPATVAEALAVDLEKKLIRAGAGAAELRDLTVGTTYVPGRAEFSQPRTLFTSGGVRFTMRPLTEAQLAARHEDGVIFPSTLVQVEYSSGVGYGVNTFLSKRVPVFWGGHALVDQGAAVHVQHNVFHTRRVFALDVGADVGSYRTREQAERFATVSAYPLLRFTFLRRRPADVYFAYSLAGPSVISATRAAFGSSPS